MTNPAAASEPSTGGRGVVVNTIRIARPDHVVFDYLTDLRREPEWNAKLKSVRPLTDGPLRVGSRFAVTFEGVGDAVIEYHRLERPRLWMTTSTGRRLDVRFVGEVTAQADGCLVRLRTELFPHGLLRFAKPLINRTMRRSWDGHLATIRSRLESAA